MARIEIDDSLFPILMQYMPAEVGDSDVEEMIGWYDRFLARSPGPHAVVVDTAPDHRGLNAVQRKRIASWQEQLYATDPGKLGISTAIVLRSAVARGGLIALDWISPPRAPRKVFPSLDEAFEWTIAMLERAKVAVPSRVREHHRELAAKAARR